MTFLRFCLATLVLAVTAQPAAAAEISAAGAAQLKTIVDTFLKEQEKLAEIDGMTKIEYQGDVVVEEADGYYAVTLPYTRIVNPLGDNIDVGMVSVNASQGDEPGQWKMRVAIPTPIVVTDKGGKEILRITIGGQRAAGLWDETMQSFVKLDALYKDMLFTGPEASVKIPETQILYDFSKDAAGKWSGPGSLSFTNIEASSSRNDGTVKVANAKIEFSIDQYDANAIKSYREKLVALGESIANDPGTKDGKISAVHGTAIANLVMELFTNAGNGMKINYDLRGVEMTRDEPAAPGEPQTIAIPKLTLGMDLGGFTTGKVRFALQAGYSGLSLVPAPPESEGLLPTEFSFDLMVDNIPIRDIIDLGRNTLDATVAQPEMKNLAGVSFLFKLPALLSQSGTHATTNAHIGNPEIDVKVEGRARADIAAVNSATADARATFRGLDLLLTRLKDQAKISAGDQKKKLQSTIAQLEAVRQHAKIETVDGQQVHVLEFTMTPKGEMLLNGTDIRALQGKPAQGIDKPAPVPEPAPPQPAP